MRYFIGFLITVGLIIFLIYLLFSGGGEKPQPAAKSLESYAPTSAEVSMHIDGPVNSSSLHQQIRVTVSRDDVTYEQMQGYNGNVTKLEVYPNTEESYRNFLRALATSGFTKGNKSEDYKNETGHCPLGSRYVFELRDGLRSIQRFWTTTCGKPKSYLGNAPVTIELFEKQVPNYDDLSQNVRL